MCAAVDDIHHRHRQTHRAGAAEIAIQRQAGFFSGGFGHGHRHGQRGVGAEAGFVLGAVEIDQGAIDEGLLFGIQADERFGDFGIDVLDSLQHALAQVAGSIAIAQLDGFTRTGRCT